MDFIVSNFLFDKEHRIMISLLLIAGCISYYDTVKLICFHFRKIISISHYLVKKQ